MEPFVTMDELGQRIDWELEPAEERIAAAALTDASDEARHYGRNWDPAAAPRLVKTIVLKAVVRYLRNPDGYTSSRAGDETLTWSDRGDPNAGAVSFTRDEIALLRESAGNPTGLGVNARASARQACNFLGRDGLRSVRQSLRRPWQRKDNRRFQYLMRY